METLEKLISQLTAVDAEIDALLANDELDDAQRLRHEALQKDRAKLLKSVAREQEKMARDQERERLLAEQADLEEKRKRLTSAPRDRLTTADLPNGADVPGLRVRDRRDTVPAQYKHYGRLKNFQGIKDGRSAEERAWRFGQWCLSTISQQIPRYRFKAAEEWVDKNLIAATTVDGSTGYMYLVPEEFGTDLINLREIYGVVRRIFKNVPMKSDTRNDPRRQGGLTAYFVAEGQPGTESNKTWNQVKLTAKDLMVIARYTSQLAADAVVNIGDDLAGEIAYAFTNKEDDCGFNGDGTSGFGGIVGARTKLVNCDTLGNASAGLFVATGHASWGALTMSDFLAVLGLLPQYAAVRGAVWVCHRAFWANAMARLEQAQGGVTTMETRAGETTNRPTFLGYPVEFAQIMPGASASAQVCCLFGNMEMGASFGDRQQDSIAFSDSATVTTGASTYESTFERNEIAIRGTERFDINVHDAGTTTVAGPICGIKTG